MGDTATSTAGILLQSKHALFRSRYLRYFVGIQKKSIRQGSIYILRGWQLSRIIVEEEREIWIQTRISRKKSVDKEFIFINL